MIRARIAMALAFSSLIAEEPGHAEPRLRDCGNGVILFTVAADETLASRPYLSQIEADGWKVEIHAVEATYKRETEYANAVRRRIEAARQEGCRRFALAGESFDAWVSLLANASFRTPENATSLRAVIAIDASAAKASAPREGWHDYKFVNHLKAQIETRLALFLYDTAPDEADGRRAEISRSLPIRFATRE